MHLILALLGAALVLYLLRDIFHTVFTPRGTGSIGDVVARWTWRVFRRMAKFAPGALSFAGPMTLILVIATWTVLMVLGWAFIYWVVMPNNFIMPQDLKNAPLGFLDALYVSFVNLVTLGLGDAVPASKGLRLFIPFEALIGFALFTASISWVLGTYPVVERRRTLSGQVCGMREWQDRAGSFLQLQPLYVATVLHGMAIQFLGVQNDLIQFPVTYYFHATRSEHDLVAWFPFVLQLADRASRENEATVAHSGSLLAYSLRELLKTVAPFVQGNANDPVPLLIERWQRDHMISQDKSR